MNKEKISHILRGEGIDLFAFLSLCECKVTKKYLLDKAGIEGGSVIMLAVPYVSEDFGTGNLSEYAKCNDYHLFWREFFDRVIPMLSKEFPLYRFSGFSDHSPIDERDAAALGGLGIIGRNSLLITEKYSSFVFLGEIVTDMAIESDAASIRYCEDCGACLKACPISFDPTLPCLSSVTQKKGALTDSEVLFIKKHRTAWGCDLCQTVCPHTQRALKNKTIYSRLPFFTQNRLPFITYSLVSMMDDMDFARRAYSWRGRQTVLRNLEILEEDD